MPGEWESKPHNERKCLQKTHMIKDYYLKYTKNSENSTIRKQPDFKMGQRPSISQKKKYRYQVSKWKDSCHHLLSGKLKETTVRYHYAPTRTAQI